MRGIGKAAYLHKLTERTQHFKSVNVGEKLDGSSPPSVFVGKFGYPKVFVGPMLSQQHGDTSHLDTPEEWLNNSFLPQIVNFRLSLVRGKALMPIQDTTSKFVRQLQEIALAKTSAEAEAEFKKKPRGVTFNQDHSPFGPSAQIKKFEVGNVKWERHLEKVYYDTDLKAVEAVKYAYEHDVLFSQIQKAFSVGTTGLDKNRKLVPTRWSITAVDDTLGKYLLEKVKLLPILETYQVYEFSALKNNFLILLLPTPWQYEWMEAFIHVMGNEEVLFSDWEPYTGKKEYSVVGGCFYSVRMAVAEALVRMGRQSGAIVFREAYPGYIPTGVWLCREETRKAMQNQPREFDSLITALDYISTKLMLPMSRFRNESNLLRFATQQTSLSRFFCAQ